LCGLCSTPFAVAKQQETALLFAPQVYSNKMPLHGATARRDICPICGLEMMLRQILMNRSNATGRHFEGRQIRYLYFYPTYFFSPETMDVFRTIHNRLQRISFTELRRQLTVGTMENGSQILRLDASTLQHLEPLLLAIDDLSETDTDRYTRMHFPKGDPVTFYFLGIPPAGRDAKDAESWIHPAFLALLMPICVDVKVVASASPLPLLLDAHEMDETVFLDGAHSFVRSLVERDHINIDQVLPTLQRLMVGYLIHVDANSRQVRGQWDYRWSDIPPLSRDLAADAAYAFHYLKKWQRNAGLESIPMSKTQQYLTYFDYLKKGGNTMSHASELVALSRQFYRAKGYRTNNILRPLSVAAKAVLAIDPRLFETQEDVVEVVHGELNGFMKRVRNDAYGFPSPRDEDETPQEAEQRREAYRQRFADYFVGRVFYEALRGDVAALRGKQLNLLKNAYEVCYLDAARRDRQAGKAMDEEIEDVVEDEVSPS
jgi:CRISPR-associated protein Csc3